MARRTIGDLAALPDHKAPDYKAPDRANWTRISKGFAAEIDACIACRTARRDHLDTGIGCGCLSVDHCAIWNAADREGTKGPGPRHSLPD